MSDIVNLLLLLVSLTGPVAVAILVLGSNRSRTRRNVLVGVATVAMATFTIATYVEIRGLPPSGVGPEAGPQDARAFAIANAFLAGIVYLLTWGVCRGFDSVRRRIRGRLPTGKPVATNRAQRRLADKVARRH